MRTSSRESLQPLERNRAWACLVANAALLPGLGSLLIGRRRAGVIQALMSSAGIALGLLWFWSYAMRVYREGTFFVEPWTFLNWALAGLVMFAVAWTWGIWTGVQALRNAAS